MADNIDTKNINQVISLIKANTRVLEDDVKNSFTKHGSRDFLDDIDHRDYN